MKKKDYKRDFWKLVKKNENEINFNKRFFPNDVFLKKIYKENHQLLEDGNKLKSNKDFKKAYEYAIDIMLRHDDWMFDGRNYTKKLKKPKLTFKPDLNKHGDWVQQISKYHVFEFNCGDLYLRNNVNSDEDLHYSYLKIKKYFSSIKNNIDKFRWGMTYSYPKPKEIKKLENTQKFDHHLCLNTLSFQAISYNFYSDQKNRLIITSDLLKENLDPLVNFISRLNNLKIVRFRDVAYEDIEYPNNNLNYFEKELKNPNFFNYNNLDLKQRKIKLRNLLKLRKSINKKIKFLLETWEFENDGYEYNTTI